MPDIAVVVQLCAAHCLHYGVSGNGAGVGRCCFCNGDFGTPATPNLDGRPSDDSRMATGGSYPDGSFYAAIVAAGGNV